MAKPLRERTRVARRLRSASTDLERIFWRALRERLSEWKFRRQHPIGSYVVDFACPARKLVVELDGGQHAAQVETDRQRTKEIAKFGYRVIRFWNNEITDNLDGVLQVVEAELRAAPPHPASPPPGAERG